MTVHLVVDLKGRIPVYEQIRAQLAGYISTGALGAGDRLPTVRGLAADLGIAVNTVARAYTELESAGLVSTGRRVGTVVTASDRAPIPAEVLEAADRLAAAVATAGLTEQIAIDVLHAALRRAGSAGAASGEPEAGGQQLIAAS
jgi:DNA-binding transcriptional regulator YhcF (GntR family)